MPFLLKLNMVWPCKFRYSIALSTRGLPCQCTDICGFKFQPGRGKQLAFTLTIHFLLATPCWWVPKRTKQVAFSGFFWSPMCILIHWQTTWFSFSILAIHFIILRKIMNDIRLLSTCNSSFAKKNFSRSFKVFAGQSSNKKNLDECMLKLNPLQA